MAHPPLLLKNGRLIDPASGTDKRGAILVVDGRIAGTGKQFRAASLPAGTQTIDLKGKWLCPGFIDMHVHLREPGEEYKETIASGTRAAAAGGFTAVACMPNTKPANDCATVTALILERAKNAAARVYPVGAISQGSRGETLAEYGELKKAGAVAVSDDGLPVTHGQLMRRALEYAGNFGLRVISHSEDLGLAGAGVMNEGELSTRLGLQGIPRVAEDIMVYRDISLACYTKRPIHIAHISTMQSVTLVRWAKANGCQVTAETAPHYFTLTEAAVGLYDTLAKMNPPLRTPEDVAAIKAGLADGTIDAIASDHAPHSSLEKEVEFDRAANGIIGLETAVPLALELVRAGVLTERRLVELFSVNPARILGVEGGTLAEGARADLTVIDPTLKFVYTKDKVVSRSANTPFLGRTFIGKAVLTIVGGIITHSEI
jgi:dihydroorotase